MNNNDKKPQAEKIEDILGRLMAKKEFKKSTKLDKLRKRWRKEVGELLSQHTRLVSLRAGNLRVEVANSMILQELSSFHKPSLITALNEEYKNPYVQEIKFYLGTF